MYLDRNLTNHSLMQAIARTNRPATGKENGEIVDFQGVFENINEALDYDAETKAYAARDKDELFDDLVDQLESVWAIFDGIPKVNTQEATYKAVERVSTHPELREFKQGFRRLQNLYEAVACTCPAAEYHGFPYKHALAVESNDAVLKAATPEVRTDGARWSSKPTPDRTTVSATPTTRSNASPVG